MQDNQNKIKSVTAAYAAEGQKPEVYAVTVNPLIIASRPEDAVREILLEEAHGKPAYIGYNYNGGRVFHIFADAATVKYITN